jgi:hypothetical protein
MRRGRQCPSPPVQRPQRRHHKSRSGLMARTKLKHRASSSSSGLLRQSDDPVLASKLNGIRRSDLKGNRLRLANLRRYAICGRRGSFIEREIESYCRDPPPPGDAIRGEFRRCPLPESTLALLRLSASDHLCRASSKHDCEAPFQRGIKLMSAPHVAGSDGAV